MKYCKQLTNFDCGPIAVINALKWAGYPFGFKDLKKFRKRCKTDKEGTFPLDLYKILKTYSKIKVKRYNKIKMRNILKDLLDEDVSYIVTHPDLQNEEEGHFSFWYSRTDKFVKAANIIAGESDRNISIKCLPVIEEALKITRVKDE